MASRSYVRTISTATSGGSFQIAKKGRIKVVTITTNNPAAGEVELSFGAASQLTSTTPDSGVICRSTSGVTPFSFFKIELDVPVEPFQYVYFHQSGAANNGTAVLVVQES